ncbi:ABC transporter permease [candidate division KSB1 bacterium]|nr:ABC transporter permease [candidate division KSB1 bacterium]
MNKKIFAIISREFLTRVRTKGFIIGTLIFPLLICLMFGGIFIFQKLAQPSTKTFYIIDQSEQIFEDFSGMFTDTLSTGEPKYIFTEKKVATAELDSMLNKYQRMVWNKQIDGYFVIPENIVESKEVTYSAQNVSDYEEQRSFRWAFSRIIANMRLESIGLPAEKIREEMSKGNIRLVSRQVTEEGEIEKSGVSSFLLAYFLTYIMVLMIVIYGQTLMRSVIEEKSQRITETIISSVKPFELMMGKIVGICALGLIQLLVMGLFMFAVIQYGSSIFINFGATVPEFFQILSQINFSPTVFGFMILFFLMGFIFFSSLFAGIGAMVNTDDEGSQLMTPVIFTLFFGFMIMIALAKNPDSAAAFWMSFIPIFTPSVMFGRIAVSDPLLPSGTIMSIVVMLISLILLIKLIAKIYRVGILMYGKKPSIKEAIKWIKYK